MPVGELTEEEALTLALKAVMDIALEEQVAGATSNLFDEIPGSFTYP